ncbi:MAG: BON domain-containing protein [Myxococcota bacterium]
MRGEPRTERAPAEGEAAFLDPSRASHSEQSFPLGGVPRALREAAELAGIDPVSELYNESLRYAQEGHLRLARERLQMLLCMAPDDGEARLMLARVFVAGQRWSDALAALDEAVTCGVDVPMSLRRAVEDHLRSERLLSEEQTAAHRAREEGEVKALRHEARRLRSEHAALAGQTAVLEREVRKWAWATASVSALACVFIAGSLVLGARSEPEAPAAEAAAVVGPPDAGAEPDAAAPEVAPAEAPAAPAPVVDLPTRVTEALAGVAALADTSVQATVTGDKVVLSGSVVSYRQRRAAERAVAAVEGVTAVDATGVQTTVRTKGAVHTVAPGDTLSHLAYAYYGESSRTGAIERANHIEGQVLKIGQQVVIPPLD